jgi:hypothetical protein
MVSGRNFIEIKNSKIICNSENNTESIIFIELSAQ